MPAHPALWWPSHSLPARPPCPAGVELIKLMHEYGVDLDAATPKNWTPLSYCKVG